MSALAIAAIQHRCDREKAANLDYICTQIRRASARGAQLIVLQELHNTLYFCCELNPGHFDLAETVPGPSTDRFSALARELEVIIVCSLFEQRRQGVYHNTAAVIECDGSLAGVYRKMHLPHDPGFEEKYYFAPGDHREDGFWPIPTSLGKLGVLICWDQWYPEAARIMALHGADLLIFPTAIGWDPDDTEAQHHQQLDAWITIQRSHSIANGLPVVACNRIGFEQGSDTTTAGSLFWGNSFITDSMGKVLAHADHTTSTILMAEINLEESETTRRTWPFLRDRRIDAYRDILKR